MTFGESALTDGLAAFGIGISMFANVLGGFLCFNGLAGMMRSPAADTLLRYAVVFFVSFANIGLAAHVGVALKSASPGYVYIASGTTLVLFVVSIVIWSRRSNPDHS
jgi:hypothetical protein